MSWIKLIIAAIKGFFSMSSGVSGDNRADFDILTNKYRELYQDMYEKQEARMVAMEAEITSMRKEIHDLNIKLSETEDEMDEMRMRESECVSSNKILQNELSTLNNKYEALKMRLNNE